MNKMEKWLKEKGYTIYEFEETIYGFTILCAIKESIVLFIPKGSALCQGEFLGAINNCGILVGFCADSFEAFEKRMKELKLWIY